MAQTSAADLLILHTLGVKSFADATTIADLVARPVAEVEDELERAKRGGFVDERSQRVSGWALTPAGQARHEALIRRELDTSDVREVFEAAYPEFAKLDVRLQQVCSEWHLRQVGGHLVPNRHDDRAYDRSILAALRQVDDRAQSLCARFSAVLSHMSPYGRRLTAALTRVEAGDVDSFTRPLAGSYYDVWTELRQDLVITMNGIRAPVSA